MSKLLLLVLASVLVAAAGVYLEGSLLPIILLGLVWLSKLLLEAWQYVRLFFESVHLYDVLWLALLPRIKGFLMVDVWKRIFIKGVAPIVFLDARNRRLIAKRTALLVNVAKALYARIWSRLVALFEPWCGRYAATVLTAVVIVIGVVIIHATYGVWLLIGVVTLPQWLTSRLWALVRFVVKFGSDILFRTAMLLGLVRFWDVIAPYLPRNVFQRFRRARRLAVRLLIERRRETNKTLRRVTWWERATATYLAFWDMFFARLEAKVKRSDIFKP